MNLDVEDDAEAEIEQIARSVRTIAIVGLSPREDRPSWGVARYLQSQGYKIIPVNPTHVGKTILDERCYARLADIPDATQVDMVDIFRRSDAVGEIVDEALTKLPNTRVIWTQLGVRDDVAAARARDHGLIVVQDRCPKIEFPRYV